VRRIALLLAVAVACKSSAPAVTDPKANYEIASEEVTFAAGANQIPGTLVRPAHGGPWPAVVLMAGSGPTDRDWNNPLLVGKNGSGKLLAEALARRGAIVLRFDKTGIGGNKTPLDKLTFDVYVAEGSGALAYLRTRKDVAPSKLFVAGHSEGGIHATRVALAEGNRIAGLLLLSAAGRSMKDIMLAQIEAQLRTAMPQQADAELASLRAAFDDFLAGKEVDPTKVSSIAGLQQLVAAIVAPQTATIARGLIAFDPAPALAQVRVPVFIYNGKHDVQVDADVDAKRLTEARHGKAVEVFIAPEADHVLKHETKTLEQLRGNLLATQAGYNSDARQLDEATVTAIAAWLAKLTG